MKESMPPMGFRGISRLVSDISADLSSAAMATAEGMAAEWPAAIDKERWASNFLDGDRGRRETTQPDSRSEGLGEVLQFLASRTGCLVLIGCIYGLFSAFSYVSSCISGPSGGARSSTYRPPSTAQPQLPAPTPIPLPAALPDFSESRPQEGRGLRLSSPEVRYCVFEDVRLSKMKPLVTNNARVSKFNEYVKDYNSRCGNYRYVEGVLDLCKRQAAERDGELETEARTRLGMSAGKK